MKARLGIVMSAFLVIGCAWGLHALFAVDAARRCWKYAPDMARTSALKSQSAWELLPGGTAQQPLPEGVAVRGELDFPYGSSQEEATRAGRELKNPFKGDDPEVLEQGAQAYAIFCIHCHDAQGGGHGPVVLHGMVPPPSLLGAQARAMKDGEMFHIITMGRGNMASYGAQVDPSERWKIIRFIRSLQRGEGQ